jgi:imidazolonepropionase-like amidohydrolase
MRIRTHLLSILAMVFLVTGIPARAGDTVIALRAARMWDGVSEACVTDAVVLIQGDRILSVGSRIAIPAGARVIDMGSATILPGLIDAHTHLLLDEDAKLNPAGLDMLSPMVQLGTATRALRGARIAREYVSAGFAFVRDVGNVGNGGDIALRDAIRDGWVQGPSMQVSTRAISGPRGQFAHLAPEHKSLAAEEYAVIDDAASAARAVRHAVSDGADLIKVILDPTFDPNDLRAIVAEARRLKRKVAAHATSEVEVLMAAECGVDSIEHGTQGVPDEAIRLMAVKRITYVPTIVSRRLAQALYVEAQGFVGKAAEAEAIEDAKWLASMGDAIMRARKAGVRVVLGSDIYHRVPGMTRGECALEVLVGLGEAGMRPVEALRAATSDAAELMGIAASTGQVKAGFTANLLVVDGDPLKHLEDTRRTKLVMLRGAVQAK